MELSDVIGFTLSDGKKLLDNAGVTISAINLTSPPRMADLKAEDYFRILRIIQIDRLKVELIVCKPL